MRRDGARCEAPYVKINGTVSPAETVTRLQSMDENRVSGTAKNLGGKVEEGFGRVTGDARTQTEGMVKQVTGTAQDMYGQARDAAADMAGTARIRHRHLRKNCENTIETQPYTSVFVGIGLGWLLGRMRRPL